MSLFGDFDGLYYIVVFVVEDMVVLQIIRVCSGIEGEVVFILSSLLYY